MKDKILALAHFTKTAFPQTLALIAHGIWDCGYHAAITIIRAEIKKSSLISAPNSSRITYFPANINEPEKDPIIRQFMDNEDMDKVLKAIEKYAPKSL